MPEVHCTGCGSDGLLWTSSLLRKETRFFRSGARLLTKRTDGSASDEQETVEFVEMDADGDVGGRYLSARGSCAGRDAQMRKFGLADEGRMKTMRVKERHGDGQAVALK